jgi:hypothetical protein
MASQPAEPHREPPHEEPPADPRTNVVQLHRRER